MGEDAEHVIKDSSGRFWEEDKKGMWRRPEGDPLADKLTFTQLVSRHGPIRIFVELTR